MKRTLNFFGFGADPEKPEYRVDHETLTNLEKELIDCLMNLFGPKNPEAPTDQMLIHSQTQLIDVIAEITNHFNNCLLCIEDNNVYMELPSYNGLYYNDNDVKCPEYIVAVVEHCLRELLNLIHFHLIDKCSAEFSIQYNKMSQIIHTYASNLNLDTALEWYPLEA